MADVISEVSEPFEENSGHRCTDKPHGAARVYHELTRKLIRESRTEGLILFIDDLQWADPATLDFLS